jgi:hypothetical protein
MPLKICFKKLHPRFLGKLMASQTAFTEKTVHVFYRNNGFVRSDPMRFV